MEQALDGQRAAREPGLRERERLTWQPREHRLEPPLTTRRDRALARREAGEQRRAHLREIAPDHDDRVRGRVRERRDDGRERPPALARVVEPRQRRPEERAVRDDHRREPGGATLVGEARDDRAPIARRQQPLRRAAEALRRAAGHDRRDHRSPSRTTETAAPSSRSPASAGKATSAVAAARPTSAPEAWCATGVAIN